MTAAVAVRRTLSVSTKRLRALLDERGLQLIVAERDQLVARWPVDVQTVVQDGRRVVVLRMNDRGEWRAVLMVGNGTNGFALVAQENRFRDLLHVSLWLETHAPANQQKDPVVQ